MTREEKREMRRGKEREEKKRERDEQLGFGWGREREIEKMKEKNRFYLIEYDIFEIHIKNVAFAKIIDCIFISKI